jgi:hypothetical protein
MKKIKQAQKPKPSEQGGKQQQMHHPPARHPGNRNPAFQTEATKLKVIKPDA